MNNIPELIVFLGFTAEQYASITSKIMASSLYDVGFLPEHDEEEYVLGMVPSARHGRNGGGGLKQLADQPLLLLLLFKETCKGGGGGVECCC